MNSIDIIIGNLKIISLVQKNTKLYIYKGQLAIDNRKYFQGIQRWLNRDSRDNIILYIRSTIQNAIILANDLDLTSEINNLLNRRIIYEIKSCIAGLENLKITYMLDTQFTTAIDLLIDNINIFINKSNVSCKSK